MRAGKLAVVFTFLVFFAAFAAVSAHADLYWESENVSKGIPHQPDGMKIHKNYFTATATRIDPGDGKVIIIDYTTMMGYTLNPQNRTYSQMNLGEPPPLPPDMPAAEKKKMDKMMGEMMQFNITPTNETKTIEGYKCRKYLADMVMMQGEYWVSKDVKGYQELRSMSAKMAAAAEKNPMLRQMNVAAMIEKLDGFPVQTVNSMMGGTITSTLKKVEQRSLDPALFKVPKDYKLREMRMQ
ncbi:MAG: DUF4412 domain-containing protein [Syntrophobacteraceae bacterium]